MGKVKKMISKTVPLYIWLIVCSFFFVLSAHAFESELWPEEGRPVFRANTDLLVLYKEPDKSSPVAERFKIKKGGLIAFAQTRYRNIKAGKIKVLESTTLEGRNFGSISYLSDKKYYSGAVASIKVLFNREETFDYLQYRAEGSCIIRLKGNIFDLEYCPWFHIENKDFSVVSEPINEWWIRVIEKNKPIGWLLVDENVTEADRTF